MAGGPEARMRQTVRFALNHLDAVSVENYAHPGTPDLNVGGTLYPAEKPPVQVEAWIELKYVRSWPRDPRGVLRVAHFTPHQRVWLRRRWKAGGNAYLLAKIAGTWLLFDGMTAADHFGKLSRIDLCPKALKIWGNTQYLFRELKWSLTRSL